MDSSDEDEVPVVILDSEELVPSHKPPVVAPVGATATDPGVKVVATTLEKRKKPRKRNDRQRNAKSSSFEEMPSENYASEKDVPPFFVMAGNIVERAKSIFQPPSAMPSDSKSPSGRPSRPGSASIPISAANLANLSSSRYPRMSLSHNNSFPHEFASSLRNPFPGQPTEMLGGELAHASDNEPVLVIEKPAPSLWLRFLALSPAIFVAAVSVGITLLVLRDSIEIYLRQGIDLLFVIVYGLTVVVATVAITLLVYKAARFLLDRNKFYEQTALHVATNGDLAYVPEDGESPQTMRHEFTAPEVYPGELREHYAAHNGIHQSQSAYPSGSRTAPASAAVDLPQNFEYFPGYGTPVNDPNTLRHSVHSAASSIPQPVRSYSQSTANVYPTYGDRSMYPGPVGYPAEGFNHNFNIPGQVIPEEPLLTTQIPPLSNAPEPQFYYSQPVVNKPIPLTLNVFDPEISDLGSRPRSRSPESTRRSPRRSPQRFSRVLDPTAFPLPQSKRDSHEYGEDYRLTNPGQSQQKFSGSGQVHFSRQEPTQQSPSGQTYSSQPQNSPAYVDEFACKPYGKPPKRYYGVNI